MGDATQDSARQAPSRSDAELPHFLVPTVLRFTEEGAIRLIGSRCGACALTAFPAVTVCSTCLAEEMHDFELPQSGILYAFSQVHVGPAKWLKPYTLGYVDLPGGLRLLSHIVGAQPRIGQRVTLDVGPVAQSAGAEPIVHFIFRAED